MTDKLLDIDFEFEAGHLENGVWLPQKCSDDGRIDIKFSITNNSDYRILFVEPEFIPFDENKKITRCRISYRQIYQAYISRVIYPRQTYSSFLENIWYNQSICKVYVEYAGVTYSKNAFQTVWIEKSAFLKQ